MYNYNSQARQIFAQHNAQRKWAVCYRFGKVYLLAYLLFSLFHLVITQLVAPNEKAAGLQLSPLATVASTALKNTNHPDLRKNANGTL